MLLSPVLSPIKSVSPFAELKGGTTSYASASADAGCAPEGYRPFSGLSNLCPSSVSLLSLPASSSVCHDQQGWECQGPLTMRWIAVSHLVNQ